MFMKNCKELKEGIDVVQVYVTLVRAGLRALDENEEGIPLVPINLREQVREAINAS